MIRKVLLAIVFLSATQANASSLPFEAGHKTECLAYEELAWDQKYGNYLQFLVDIGVFPPGVDFAVAQLAYSLSTPKSIDPVRGSSRFLLNQIWYPVSREDAAGAQTTVHTDFFTNNQAGKPLATAMSSVLNVGGLIESERTDYPNAPEGYGALLSSDLATQGFVVDGEANSVEGAPIAADNGPFPLIILDSPGHEQLHIAEELAKRGYIVIAPTHPGDQFYGGILDVGIPLDGTPIGGIPYGLNCDIAKLNAAKPVNGILDFNSDITDTWLVEGGVYLGASGGSIQETLQLRAVDIGMLISRADTFFAEAGVVDQDRVGLLGYSLGGNTVQLIVSDDAGLADPSIVPAEARAGLDAVDAIVALAGNNRFISGSSTATTMQKPALAIQGRQDLVVNQGVDTIYGGGTLEEPNAVFADNFANRYGANVPAMRVLVDRFGHSDFQSGEPLVACLEHGGGDGLVPNNCVQTRPVDERFSLVAAEGGGLEIGGSYVARPLQERLDIPMFYTSAWFDLFVKGESCSANRELHIDGKRLKSKMSNLKRLKKKHFKPRSIEQQHRNLDVLVKSKGVKGLSCS